MWRCKNDQVKVPKQQSFAQSGHTAFTRIKMGIQKTKKFSRSFYKVINNFLRVSFYLVKNSLLTCLELIITY
jgi:hypothetical protein